MAVIDLFATKEEFLSFRDHVGDVMRHKNFGISLKQRNIDELAAMLAGAKDFNTALGICAKEDTREFRLSDELPVPGGEFLEIDAWFYAEDLKKSCHFEALDYFNDCLENNSLAGVLAMIWANDKRIGTSAARLVSKSNEELEGLLSECFATNTLHTVIFNKAHLSSWLLNKQQYILASWMSIHDEGVNPYDPDDEVEGFAEYCRDFSELCYHSGTEGEIDAFMQAMGDAFRLSKAKRQEGFRWTYQHTESTAVFPSKIEAIVDFLDQLVVMLGGEHPAGKIMDPRLTHYIVADNNYWGIGRTFKEAKLARPYYGTHALSAHAKVWHCTANTRINEMGGMTQPKEDPVAVEIDRKTGKPV